MYDIEKLRFWCQKVIPLVYEDSLSYYELLCKVVKKLNEVIESVDGLPDLIAEMISDENIGEIISRLLNNLEEQIAGANEELSETATADRVVGCLVWLNGDLYRATKYIDAGDRYVVDGNVEKITIEEVIKGLQLAITDNYEDGERVASADREAGELVWFKNELLLVKEHIDEGNAYTDANSEVVDFSSLFLTIENAISSEATARANADTALGTRIDNEITARENADTALGTRIDNEVTARGNADTALGTRIDNEVTARENADTAINNEITNINTELDNIDEQLTAFVTPEMFGAYGDGVHDDTTAIRSAINSGASVIVFGSKTYLISVDDWNEDEQAMVGLHIKSGQRIIMNKGTVINMNPCTSDKYYIFFISDETDIEICGGIINGDRLTHVTSGSASDPNSGMGIKIMDGKNIYIHDLIINNALGDGLYVGNDNADDRAEDILVENCIFKYSGRNNVSIINVDTLTFKNCEFLGATFNLPKSGVDIEINYYAIQLTKNITFNNCKFRYNTIGISMLRMGNNCGFIYLNNCEFINNIGSAIVLDEDYTTNHQTAGTVIIDGGLIAGGSAPFSIKNKIASGYSVFINDIEVTNVLTVAPEDLRYDAIIDWRTGDNIAVALGNVHFSNIRVWNEGRTPTWLINQNLNDKIQKITFTLNRDSKNVPTKYMSINSDSEFDINIPNNVYHIITATGTNMAQIGKEIYNNVILNGSVSQSIAYSHSIGINSRYNVYNASSYSASISLDGDVVSLPSKKTMRFYYNYELSQWVYEIA